MDELLGGLWEIKRFKSYIVLVELVFAQSLVELRRKTELCHKIRYS